VRLENLREVVSSTLNEFCNYHEYKCVFGDLNFRIDMDGKEVRDLVTSKDYTKLLEQDQLTKCMPNNPILSNFKENLLEFDPTYKYDKNSSNYDTSMKQRIPAWCDRILIYREGGKHIAPESYQRIESQFSDHRPVVAVFNAEIT
jgi:hypothetical protein